ncbi:MAG: 30S ribosomal protein S21 [Elusimicrobiota bacterium]|nr:30S ribosomal protein S21 [Endomicrobiia bacterium]MDW8166779.1 30S ribosomal protein S21 [Elusimicrobiota bacterium]
MVEVKVREGEKLEDALRRFKREVEKEGILKLAREKMYYKSPSVIKKEKMAVLKRKLELKRKKISMNKNK